MMYIKNTIQDFVIKFKTNDLNMGEIDFTAEENKSSIIFSMAALVTNATGWSLRYN